jgi:hypothetical protein
MAGAVMRNRDINPKYFVDEDLAKCSFPARILFAGLWCAADREGRLEDRPGRLKGEIFPHDPFTIAEVDGFLDELARHHIRRYEVDGKKYIQIRNFLRFQKIHPREQQSQIPPEPDPKGRAKGKPRKLQGMPKANLGKPEAGQGDPKANQGAPKVSQGSPKVNLGEPTRAREAPGISGPSVFSGPSVSQSDAFSKNENASSRPAAARAGPASVKPTPSPEALQLAEKLRTAILARDPLARCRNPAVLARWAGDIDLLIRIDDRAPPDIARVIDWCQAPGNFWNGNVLSGRKLREKFDQLWAQMNRDPARKSGPADVNQIDRVVALLNGGARGN